MAIVREDGLTPLVFEVGLVPRGDDTVRATHVHFESGVVVFSNGLLPDREFVQAFGPGQWTYVVKLGTVEECYGTEDDDDDEGWDA